MKAPTVFLGEMTNPEVEAFLKSHHTVIVPTGATEQHGPHAPLLTDVLIPQEVARRVAPTIGAVVAPPINYALSYPHVGFTGLVHIRIPTFMALIEDLCVSFAASGSSASSFSTAITTTPTRLPTRCAIAADKMPKDVKAFPINYWDGLTRRRGRGVLRLEERPARERGRDLSHPRASIRISSISKRPTPSSRRFPEFTVNTAPVHTAFFFTSPGSVYWATKSGTWGDARQSTPEIGERYIEAGVRSTLAVLDNIEKTFAAMPPR